MRPSLHYERAAFRSGAKLVAGVDEAGRGPLAGPVVAAAVILPRPFRHARLNDSKQLAPAVRAELYAELVGHPQVHWGVGFVEVEQIDRWNILRATWRAMELALAALPRAPDHVLIDGLPVHSIHLPQTAIIAGDGRSLSIAAASVIAKVTRDRRMLEIHEQYPQYNFARHKGYATAEHLAALQRHGPCPVHRQSFHPIRHALAPAQTEFPHPAAAS